jgi:hypothetical protein
MDWLNIKEVLPPETIREMLNEHNISMIKYYSKPRKITSCTTILIEVLNKNKEVIPTIIEIRESLPYYSNEKEICIEEKTVRYKDRPIFSNQELKDIATVFRLFGLKVY